jgi:hypothetical protein
MARYIIDVYYKQNPYKDDCVFLASLFAHTFYDAAEMIRNRLFSGSDPSLGSGLIGLSCAFAIRPATYKMRSGWYYIGGWGSSAPEIWMKRRKY